MVIKVSASWLKRRKVDVFMTQMLSRRGSAIYAQLRPEERKCLRMLRDGTSNDWEVGAMTELARMALIEAVKGVTHLTDEGRLVAQYC